MTDPAGIILDDWIIAIDHRGKIADMNPLPIDHRSTSGRLAIVRCVIEGNRHIAESRDPVDIGAF